MSLEAIANRAAGIPEEPSDRPSSIPGWANNPHRYFHHNWIWCLNRQGTCWWYENESYYSYTICDLAVAFAPAPAVAPAQLAQPILQHVAPAIGAAVAAATAAIDIDQEAAAARAHATMMTLQASTAADQALGTATPRPKRFAA